MKRVGIVAVLVVVVAAAVLFVRREATKPSTDYRVDVVFADARGLVAGQDVKVAGAKVGQIKDVTLTHRYQARVKMSVDSRFAPFRQDASCTIRPQGLIAENYVQCDPGTADRPELHGRDGAPPTVPVDRTTEPVNLTDLFDIFSAPTPDRFRVIIDELGIAAAGRGDDVNAILRRANPALEQARRVLAIAQAQRDQLTAVVRNTDRLVGKLAQHPERTQHFLERAARVGTRVADRRSALALTVARAPALLRQTRSSLRKLDVVAADGTPLLRSLHDAAPDIDRVTNDLPAFAAAAPAASKAFGKALRSGTTTAKPLLPVIRALQTYAVSSLPNARLSGQLFTNLRDTGFIESLLSLFYYGAAASARYDGVSHIIPAHTIGDAKCFLYTATPVQGCSANFDGSQGDRRGADARTLDYLLGP